MMMTALGLGLLVLCAVCFLGGYAFGHRSGTEAAAAPTQSTGRSAAEILAQEQSQPQKPAQSAYTPPPAAPAVTVVKAAQTNTAPAAQPEASTQPVPAGKPANQPAYSLTPASVHPALSMGASQSPQWMVQIAAVEHAEDADVLIGALRRRGYTVSVRNDPADRLLHVQVGPFGSRSDAETTRQRLTSDGYNAVVTQ